MRGQRAGQIPTYSGSAPTHKPGPCREAQGLGTLGLRLCSRFSAVPQSWRKPALPAGDPQGFRDPEPGSARDESPAWRGGEDRAESWPQLPGNDDFYSDTRLPSELLSSSRPAWDAGVGDQQRPRTAPSVVPVGRQLQAGSEGVKPASLFGASKRQVRAPRTAGGRWVGGWVGA